MVFSEKYATSDEKIAYDLNPDKDDKGDIIPFPKIIISNDAYAVGEMINNLINQIERTRTYLK